MDTYLHIEMLALLIALNFAYCTNLKIKVIGQHSYEKKI